jgi:hypothetical protein
MHASDIREASMPGTTTLLGELRRAREGKPRRAVIGRMVTELAARMHAPEGIPTRAPVAVAVEIPAGLELADQVIDPGEFYELELAGDYLELDGWELVAMCRNLISLADAARAGDATAAEGALALLCVSPFD